MAASTGLSVSPREGPLHVVWCVVFMIHVGAAHTVDYAKQSLRVERDFVAAAQGGMVWTGVFWDGTGKQCTPHQNAKRS